MTSRSIAYIAVQASSNFDSLTCVLYELLSPFIIQVRFALSSGTSWKISDIDFNHIDFYTAIVDFFDDAPGPVAQARVTDLLAWWNK